jgi:signal transduction histidine kinase
MTAAQTDIVSETATPLSPRSAQRERVKAAQDVAASLARELRAPVFAIASAAQLLRYRITDDPVIEKNIGRILREAERLNAYVNALLEYAAPTPIRLTPGDPDDVWDVVLARHRGDLESRAILAHLKPAESRATCNIDVEQLGHAMACALTNAIEAATEGSDIEISSVVTADGMWVSVLRNDGPPVDEATQARAFEPLVTTKPGHAGIGLSLAQRIVAEHGGSITLEADGAGTSVTISLPALHG